VKLGEVEVLVPSPPRSHAEVEACVLVLVNWTNKGATPLAGEAVNDAVNGDAVTCRPADALPHVLVAVAT